MYTCLLVLTNIVRHRMKIIITAVLPYKYSKIQVDIVALLKYEIKISVFPYNEFASNIELNFC